MQKAIAYYRVSTARQGKSGLGLEAQQKSVSDFARANRLKVVNDFIEVESAGNKLRHGLAAALRQCEKDGALLLIAKLDRLSRRVAFISALLESDIPFKVVDHAEADHFTLHILAAVAQKEHKDISDRTIMALAAAKRRGVRLGQYGATVLSKRNKRKALAFARRMKPLINKIKKRGITTLRGIATVLNRLHVPTRTGDGHRWHKNTVYRLLNRLKPH